MLSPKTTEISFFFFSETVGRSFCFQIYSDLPVGVAVQRLRCVSSINLSKVHLRASVEVN